MSLELRIVAGARAGTIERHDGPVVTLGRDPACDVQFDRERDRDVSARHAEIRMLGDQATVRDLGSTNGTFVNGTRVTAEHPVQDGDVLALGSDAVQLEVRVRGGVPATVVRPSVPAMPTPPLPHHTTSGPAAGHSGRLARLATAATLLLVIALGATWWLGRGAGASPVHDSASAASMVAGTLGIDHTAINKANRAAIAMVVVDAGDEKPQLGTGFAVSRDGLVVTNKHVVRGLAGGAARKVAVLFADTERWISATVVKESATDDLALLRLDLDGPFPVVQAVARRGVEEGAPLATIGFPLGTKTAMEGSGPDVIARPTLTAGIASKVLADVLQIDAFAASGSSGSPVFDREGSVVGVVFGGPPGSSGRIVYAVPAERLAAFVKGEAPQSLR